MPRALLVERFWNQYWVASLYMISGSTWVVAVGALLNTVVNYIVSLCIECNGVGLSVGGISDTFEHHLELGVPLLVAGQARHSILQPLI